MRIQIKHVKKVAILFFIMAAMLTLAACSGKDKTPFGDVGDQTYLTIGDIVITERELYEELRLQGASVLASMVDEIIFAEQIATGRNLLNTGDEKATTFLDESINEAIHRTKDKEALERLFEKTPERFNRNIEQFVDSLYLLDNSINIPDLVAKIKNLANTQDTPYGGYSSIPELVKRYELRVAQRIYARSILEEETVDSSHSQFISEDNLVNHYKSTMQGRYDVNALVIRFINLNEANAALYQLGIKSDSRGFWYQIPDIRIPVGEPGYIDLDLVEYGYVRSILSDLGILGKAQNDRNDISLLDYENYYKRYVINTSRDELVGLADEPMTTVQVKNAFVEIYNLLNPAAQIEIDVDGSFTGVGGNEFDGVWTYDDLTKINTSLRNHVYSTLISEAEITADPSLTGRPYSARVQTFGNSRFLVYKLSDDSDSEEGVLIEDPEDETKTIFASTTEAQAIRDEVFEKLLIAKLTNQYISNTVNKLYEDLELNIYDPVVRAFYEQNYGYDGATKAIDSNTVAKVSGTPITVREYFTRLEQTYGINLSLDLASNLYLESLGTYTVPASKRTEFENQFKEIIEQFSANQFATAGYPASMGREKFLLLAFGATTNQEAVNKIFIYPEMRNMYIEDLEAHFDFENYSIYQKFADLAELQYNNFKSITVSHLLIYVDTNGDGAPDDPQKYLDGLSAQGREDVLDGLVELTNLLYELVGNYKGLAEGFTALAEQFNNAGRIERGSLVPPIDYQIELLWSKYRRLGFYLRFENIPNPITNTSNFITSQTTLDKVFYNRAIESSFDSCRLAR
jgi:hypothetical protein